MSSRFDKPFGSELRAELLTILSEVEGVAKIGFLLRHRRIHRRINCAGMTMKTVKIRG